MSHVSLLPDSAACVDTNPNPLAVEVDNVGFKAARPGYGAVKADAKGMSMKIGADYKINSSTTAKIKVSPFCHVFTISLYLTSVVLLQFVGDKPEFAVKCALDGGNVVFANSGANFGMVYTLEA